jgi:hypothetical protein
MSSSGCAVLADVAPELALGILPGDERADALVHLDECAHCQQLVGSYTVVTDQLLRLGPRAEPPVGFGGRVVDAISAAASSGRAGRVDRTNPTARRRVPGAVLAVAAAVVALVIAFGVIAQPSSPSVAAAEMRTGAGTVVGEIFVHDGPPAKVFMELPGWASATGPYGEATTRYSLLITRDGGGTLLVPVTMSDDATWAATVDGVAAGDISGAALVDAAGRVWCSASF